MVTETRVDIEALRQAADGPADEVTGCTRGYLKIIEEELRANRRLIVELSMGRGLAVVTEQLLGTKPRRA